MFKNLLGFWKGKDFLAQVFDDFNQMLEDSEFMFTSVSKHLHDSPRPEGLKDKIRDVDQKINIQQREIRRRIVEHLTLQPTVEFTACLVLMSVVKDAERLGDYCKNLYEVIELHKGPIDKGLYADFFNGLNQDIQSLFEQTKAAFIHADEDKARHAWEVERKVAKACDETVKRLAQSDLTVNQAVCFTLIARHYKRIVAHLVNIATAVILPLSDLDYFDEERGEKES